ncbi:MAG: sulfatase [Bacteroidetes bacterium]|nr:sulfatase [Bacteroidota bacterium]
MRTHYLLIVLSVFLFSCQSDKTALVKSDKDINIELPFRPNIVWLVAEDLSPYIPPFGDSTVATPNLSRLAAEGVRYTHVFSPSGVCAPSRAAIATGMYPSHIGAHHMRTGGNPQYFPEGMIPYEAVPPAEVKMHSEYLRRAGYYCTNNAKEDYQFRKPVTAWDESSNQAHWRNREEGQPFFAIFNFGITHESQIWARANDSLWIDPDKEVPIPPYLPDNEIGRQDVRRMYSNIAIMDAQVGKILDQLEEDGLMDSTIIFWYSDHGGPLPRMKRLVYDSGLRLPMIIRFPGQEHAGEKDDQLVSFIDFKPTILSLAGIQPPDYVDGRAFLGEYITKPERKYIHAAADRFDAKYDMIRAVRDHRFKYLRNFHPERGYYLPVSYREQMPVMQELLRMRDAGELNEIQAQWFRDSKPEEELFDTENDPHELKNLAEDPQYAEKLAELRAECDRWMKEIDDKGLMEEPEFLETIWPGQIQPQTATPEIQQKDGKVVISCQTEGASIGYQLLKEGEEKKSWQVYTGPVDLTGFDKVRVVAHRIGFKPSPEVEL